MKVTIYEIARRGGVSISTASKALNDRKDVGDRTKEKIRRIAEELNYEPSHFARALAMRKTENVGVITGRFFHSPVITNPFYSRIIEGIEDYLLERNLSLVTSIVRKDQIDNLELPKILKEKSVDGIVLLGHMPEQYVEKVASRGIPAVMVDNQINSMKLDAVVADNEGGTYAAVTQLIKSGHKRIAYLARSEKRYSFSQRCEGYKRALRDNGLPVDEKMIIFGREDETEADPTGYNWMKPILEGRNRPDAMVMCNDVNAILAINMLKSTGLSVPDDVSVVGFDNIELSEHFIPSISTVNINKEEMGKKAVELLLDAVAGKSTGPSTVIMPSEYIQRNSVKSRA